MPFSQMPKSVKSGVGKSKKKQHSWMSTYESARNGGKSKESAAKIAYSSIRRESLSLMRVYESVEKNITEEAKKGKMVAIFIPKEIGSRLQSMFSEVKGNNVDPEDMHITIGLMRGDGKETKMANSILEDLSPLINPIDLMISKFGKFEPHESNDFKHVLYAEPSSQSLQDLHDTIFSAFEKHGLHIDNGDFDFKPHITIKYCDEEPEVDKRIESPIFRIKQLSLADSNRKFHHNLRGA